MSEKVSLLGKSLTAIGFPHVKQDTETHTCAESSLWVFMEYFGSKYSHYKTLLPSEIYKKLIDVSDHRLLPSIGLSDHELSKCLQDSGYQCLIHKIGTGLTEDNREALYLKLYIESGIPIILLLQNRIAGHALLAIGHENEFEPTVPEDRIWIDASEFKKE